MTIAKVMIAVDPDYADRIEEVVQQCGSLGMETEKVLFSAKAILGSTDVESLQSLRQLPGVAEVEVMSVIEIAPPESAVQ